jgi:thiol:disulfide interchange protein/DsbC/DsbD-like thiol-disulfide interchange protein
MFKELHLRLSKNIIKLLFFCLVLSINQSLHSDSKYFASDSSIELISNSNSIQPGDELLVGVKFRLEKDWHTYWKNPGDAGEGATIRWNLSKGLSASNILWPGPERIPVDPLMTFGYNDEVVLLTKIASDGKVNFPLKIEAKVSWFTCKDICIPQEGTVDIEINEGNLLATSHDLELKKYLSRVPTVFSKDFRVEALDSKFFFQSDVLGDEQYSDVYFFPSEYGLTSYTKDQIFEKNQNSFTLEIEASEYSLDLEIFEGIIETSTADGKKFFSISYPLESNKPEGDSSVFLLILFAFIGGLILNIMPCVFPILSIKILRFVEHSENSSTNTLKYGLFYTFGAVLSFLLIALLLVILKSSGESIGWGFQLQYPLVISILFYLFVALGFMFMSSLVFGSSLGNLGSFAQVKNESLESFLTGVLAVVVASPCTAPFMGSAIGFALLQPSLNSFVIFLSLGIGFALPYLILSIKPSLLSFLPKPGAWMATFKQFMAFPMWASALWLLWVLSGQVDQDTVLMVLIGGLVISLSLWLLEKNTSEKVLIRWSIRVLAIILVIGSISILPTQYSSKENQAEMSIYSEALLNEYLSKNQLVFLNFTADWCITCKVNERVALNSEEVLSIMEQKNIKYLEADWTRKDADIARKLEEYGRTGVPLYLLFPSDGDPIVLPEILTKDILLDYLNELT